MLDAYIVNAPATVYTTVTQHGEGLQVNTAGNVIVKYVSTQEKNR